MAPQSVTLSAGTTPVFDKLKTRSALHIKLLAKDVQSLSSFQPDNDDRESILRDVGILLQLRSKTVESVFAVVKGPKAKVYRVNNAQLKKVIEEMRCKISEDYVEIVEEKWRELDTRKSDAGEEGVQYYKDLGLLMQFSMHQHCALMEKLIIMIRKGEIEQDTTEVLMGKESFEFYFMKEVKGQWVVVSEGLDADRKRKAEDDEAQGGHWAENMNKEKKNKVHGGEKRREHKPRKYVPRHGEWKCGKCGWYSVGGWCTRQDRRGNSICIGRREES